MDDVERIAAGLSKAQRITLLNREGSHSEVTAPELDRLWFCITKLGLGLFRIDLNDLGLRVAQHLKQENTK